MTLRAWLNSLPTMVLVAMARNLGCIFNGNLRTQRQMSINFLFQVSMSGAWPMTLAQFISYYRSVVGTAPPVFELVQEAK